MIWIKSLETNNVNTPAELMLKSKCRNPHDLLNRLRGHVSGGTDILIPELPIPHQMMKVKIPFPSYQISSDHRLALMRDLSILIALVKEEVPILDSSVLMIEHLGTLFVKAVWSLATTSDFLMELCSANVSVRAVINLRLPHRSHLRVKVLIIATRALRANRRPSSHH
jgi:hypothetical protein